MPAHKPGSKTLLISWLPALACMAALFYASSLPGDRIHLPPFPYSDKAVHFAAYAALGALIGLRKMLRGPRIGAVGWDFPGLAVGMLYGVSDEIHQLFVPMRMYDYGDMAADSLGVAAGLRLFGWWMGGRPLAARGKESG
ncbi:MAG: VanZ family protein [Fibrobacteres bacterium]|nr:VanZ family protein [Fibrobacterota bacterium]